MKWLTSLFGSSKNVEMIVETGAKGLYNGIDKAFYTEEEKADDRSKRTEVFLKYFTMTTDQNSMRSITRRWLAFLVVGPTMLSFMLAIFGYLFTFEFADKMFNMFTTMIPYAAGVLVFYFGPHFLKRS